MSNENAKIDDNRKRTLLGVTDDAAAEIRRLLVDPTTGRLKVSAVISSGGDGDVVGPASATNNAIVRFDTTTGKLIQNSAVTIDDNGTVNIPTGQTYQINGSALSASDVGAEPTLTKGNLAETTSAILTITGGTNAVIGSGVTIAVQQADTDNDGYLSSTDWDTFNGKQDALTFGIANTNAVQIDDADAAENDYAKLTSSGIEGRSYSEVKTDLGLSTSDSPQFIGIELGNASDTTLTRSAAGVLAVEGVVIPSISSTNTLTNKRITARVWTAASDATPDINSDDYDAVTITALATAITDVNVTGTPTNFQKLIFRIKDDGTARAITWGSDFEAKGVALPTTTVISKVLTVGFIYDSVTSKWGCVASAQEE